MPICQQTVQASWSVKLLCSPPSSPPGFTPASQLLCASWILSSRPPRTIPSRSSVCRGGCHSPSVHVLLPCFISNADRSPPPPCSKPVHGAGVGPGGLTATDEREIDHVRSAGGRPASVQIIRIMNRGWQPCWIRPRYLASSLSTGSGPHILGSRSLLVLGLGTAATAFCSWRSLASTTLTRLLSLVLGQVLDRHPAMRDRLGWVRENDSREFQRGTVRLTCHHLGFGINVPGWSCRAVLKSFTEALVLWSVPAVHTRAPPSAAPIHHDQFQRKLKTIPDFPPRLSKSDLSQSYHQNMLPIWGCHQDPHPETMNPRITSGH